MNAPGDTLPFPPPPAAQSGDGRGDPRSSPGEAGRHATMLSRTLAERRRSGAESSDQGVPPDRAHALRIEMEPTTAEAGPMPVVTLGPVTEAPPPGGLRICVLGDECRIDRAEHPPVVVRQNEWCEAARGWRVRVVPADAPPQPPQASPVWTAPELEILTAHEGPAQCTRVAAPTEEGAQILLGRDPACDVPLDDGHVSRRHLRLFVRRGRLLAEDLRSRWGTTLNDRPLAAPSELSHGDTLVIGTTTLRYVCYWDVLTRPSRSETRGGSRAPGETVAIAPAPTPPPAPARAGPRPIAEPAPPPSAWEQNAKIVALAVMALCCVALITLLMQL